ncbi:hypothetical protein ACHAXS_010646 [Conticribra weissflogii]
MISPDRKSEFKKTFDVEDGRRRRTETTINLRKDKKSEGLAKRRARGLVTPAIPSSLDHTSSAHQPSVNTHSSKKIYTAEDIPALSQMLSQTNVGDATLLEVAQGFRKVMSVENNPPVDAVLASGVVPALVQMLTLVDKPEIQFEAAWALTNIASTEKTNVVVEAGAIPYFVQLLSSPSAEVREQSAWCLGNIAGDGTGSRDIVLAAGGMTPLIQNIMKPASNSLFSNCVWTLSNFCRGKPKPDLAQVAPAVPILAEILKGDNISAKVDALWALSYISDGDDECIQTVLDAGVANALIAILEGDAANMITPALRTVGNIVSGNDVQTQAILDAGFMLRVKSLLNNPKV